jgi:hypothetical protein
MAEIGEEQSPAIRLKYPAFQTFKLPIASYIQSECFVTIAVNGRANTGFDNGKCFGA